MADPHVAVEVGGEDGVVEEVRLSNYPHTSPTTITITTTIITAWTPHSIRTTPPHDEVF